MGRLPGVQVLSVSYARSRAEVAYDPAKATVNQMAKALSRYGYTVYPLEKRPSNLKKIVIRVKDLGNLDKILSLEEAIGKIPGVQAVRTDPVKREVAVIAEAGRDYRAAFLAAAARQGMEAAVP